MPKYDLYVGREQTLVKHFILREYLQRFAHIIGFHWNTITYVDCFSGPWQSQSEDLADTSFSIALSELRKARETHKRRGKNLNLRCLFLEKDAAAFARLSNFAGTVPDVTVLTLNCDLADAVPEILRFIQQGGSGSFPFFFIDPTGWTGFGMRQIAPLLRHQPGEVLINFMTDFINRFIDNPDQQTAEQFVDLFGSTSVRDRIRDHADPRDREETLFGEYAANVQRTGGYLYTCAATILYPERDRSYFHLIYATRSRKGVEVFKEVEKRATPVMERARAEAKQRKRKRRTGQGELFAADEMPDTKPIQELRERQLTRARQQVLESLLPGQAVPYEKVWDLALSFRLVWESDLKEWIAEWKSAGKLKIRGMTAGQRVPKLDRQNILVWQPPDTGG